MKIESDIKQINCRSCGKLFDSYWVRGGIMKRCPTCADIRQNRPSIIIDRGIEFSIECQIESLPGIWQLAQSGKEDNPHWSIHFHSKSWGASHSGRIDIYSHDLIPPQIGDNVLFDSCVAVHRRPDMPNNPLEIREYFRISRIGMIENNAPKLVWMTATSKTTIKGFGRQYKHSIVGSPLWEHRISGGVRSGRINTVGVLALIDADHPLWVKEDFSN